MDLRLIRAVCATADARDARQSPPRYGVALRLFASATEAVQKQLEVADRQKVQLYLYIVAQAKSQIQTQIRERSADYATAKPHIESLYRSGELTDKCVMSFASEDKFETIALCLLGDLPVGHIERALVHDHADHLLVIAEAISLSWETVRARARRKAPTARS